MNRRELAWFVAMALLTLLVTVSAPAFPAAQDTTGEETETPGTESAVERILRQQEQLLRGQQFGYNPENRRDPFQSLYEKIRQEVGPRPPGARGMVLSEINLDGIVRESNAGDLAFFTGSDNKGYFMRVGDQIYDATIIAIDADRGVVTFRQKVDDPRLIKPYRDVVRKLAAVDEENR